MIDSSAVEAPAFFEKLFPDKPVYWTCYGKRPRWWKRLLAREAKAWTVLHYSQEDVEAWAASSEAVGPYWEWDREPASEISLDKAMFETRRLGRQGVKIVVYVGGCWQVVSTYRVNL